MAKPTKLIFRFSYLSCVLEDAKKGTLTYPLSYYLVNSNFTFLKDFDLSLLPDDYNSDDYDLIFNDDNTLYKAEKDLEKSELIADKIRGKK